MKLIWLLALLLSCCSCTREQHSSADGSAANAASSVTDYERKLVATKAKYPFKQQSWRSSSLFAAIFDALIAELVAAGENASEAQKIACFRHAVAALNDLNRTDLTLIETTEAEQLCDLLGRIGIVTGMPPSKFPDEEGAARGRDW